MQVLTDTELNLDFQTTPDSTTDLCVHEHLRWARDYIVDYLGAERIRSIVLSGSLAIGEGSAYVDGQGLAKVLSDMDLYIIADERILHDVETRDVHAHLLDMNGALNEALNTARSDELLSPIDTIIMTPDEFRSLWTKPKIITMQLAGRARILWGDEGVVHETARVSAMDIDDADVFKLFNNRIAEQVFYLNRYDAGYEDEVSLIFHTAKSAVDTVLASCVAAGCSEHSFVKRLEIFKGLCRDTRLGPGMAEWAEFWTRYKLAPDISSVIGRYEADDIKTAACAAWEEAAGRILSALRWSVRTRLGVDEANVESLSIHLAGCFGLPVQEASRRAEIFTIELISHNLPALSSDRTTRLSELGSPRSLMYAAATLLLAATGKVETERNRILWTAGEVLPITEPIQIENSDENWKQLAYETARLWNMLVMGGRR